MWHRGSQIRAAGLALLAFVALCCSLKGQTQGAVNIELITTADGLSQGNVRDLLQDEEGFLWIGTSDGLNRYDGQNFRIFTNDPDDPGSISGNTVHLLYEDSKGRIWAFSAQSGINIYDKQTGRFYRIPYDEGSPFSLADGQIEFFVEDTSGTFIVGSPHTGRISIFQLDEDFFKSLELPEVVKLYLPRSQETEQRLHRILTGVTRDAKGRIWVGGRDITYRLDVPRSELIVAVEGYSVVDGFADADGSVWSASENQGLFYWDGDNAWTVSNAFGQASDIHINAHRQMWLMRHDSLFGLDLAGWTPGMQIDAGSEQCFFRWSRDWTEGSYPFKSITVDKSGIVWAGLDGHGLYKINPESRLFTHTLPTLCLAFR